MGLSKQHGRWTLAVIAWLTLGEVAAAEPDYVELSAFAAGSGELQLLAIRRDAQIERRYQQQAGAGFSGVETLGGEGQAITALQLPDGSLDAFLVGMDSALWENRRAVDGDWSGWERLGGEVHQLGAAQTAAGTLALVSIGAGSELELRVRADAGAALSEPVQLGLRAKQLAVIADASAESLRLFAIGEDDAVWRSTHELAAPGSSAWQSLEGLVHDVAVGRAPGGALEIAVAGDDGAVWRHVQPPEAPEGWQRLGGEAVRVAFAGTASALQLFAAAPDGSLSSATLGAQGGWSEPAPLDLTAAPPQALASTFQGEVRVEIPSLDVSVTRELAFDVRFSADRTQLEITRFDPIVTAPFDTPFGSNVSTVTWVGGGSGSFDPGSGRLELPVTLHFDQSLSIPFINTDVDASLPLSTAAEGGAPFDAQSGQLSLAAGSRFSGSGANPLSGSAVRVVLAGRFDPRP